jgi:Spy/CpxP family protein refolding chaperone
MIKRNFYKLLFSAFLLFGAITFANAQGGPPPEGDEFAPPPRRPNLLQELGLNKNQLQQLRQINREWNPRRQQAQRDFQEAKRELDEAIYLPNVDENLIDQRKEAVKRAHDELINTQTTMQTMIRRILTNQQLAKFRQLREQFAQRQGNPDQPIPVNQRNNQLNRPLKNRILRPNQRP